jgi:hypothetical protein
MEAVAGTGARVRYSAPQKISHLQRTVGDRRSRETAKRKNHRERRSGCAGSTSDVMVERLVGFKDTHA